MDEEEQEQEPPPEELEEDEEIDPEYLEYLLSQQSRECSLSLL